MIKSDSILGAIKLHGKGNPIYSCQLENQYNLKGSEIRNIIRDLRRNGEPIANSSNGYYYAKNISELKETIEDLRGRALSMINTASMMEKRFNTNKELSLF